MKKIVIIFILLTAFFSLHIIAQNADSIATAESVGTHLVGSVDYDSLHAVNHDSAQASKPDSSERKGIFSGVKESLSGQDKGESKPFSFPKIFKTLVSLIFGFFFVKLFVRILTLIAEKSTRLRITIKGLIPVVRVAIWAIIIFAIVRVIFNPDIDAVLAVIYSVSIAIGLASQDLLKNIFGGIALLLDRPFLVGDKIDTGKHYGEVIEIGLRATLIVTADDSVVSVPNADLINNAVSNSNSGELNCQVVAEIYLPIDIDTVRARKIATEAAQVSRFVYLEKPIVVLFFNEVKERRSYLKMRVKAYVMDIRYEFQFKSDLTEIVIRELLKEKVISKDDLF